MTDEDKRCPICHGIIPIDWLSTFQYTNHLLEHIASAIVPPERKYLHVDWEKELSESTAIQDNEKSQQEGIEKG